MPMEDAICAIIAIWFIIISCSIIGFASMPAIIAGFIRGIPIGPMGPPCVTLLMRAWMSSFAYELG